MQAISIHAPREGGDNCSHILIQPIIKFQSTPPARGATTADGLRVTGKYISIHAPREGGDIKIRKLAVCHYISIHAPREGGDSKDAQFYLRIFDKQVELLRFL